MAFFYAWQDAEKNRPKRKVINNAKARIYGESLDAVKAFTGWFSGRASITFQKSKKKGDIYDTANLSDKIDYLPDWKASGGLEFSLPKQSALSISLRYVGERSAIYAYTSGWPTQRYLKYVELAPYFTADISFKIPVNKHVELSCYAENLFDEEYEERFGYPMSGFNIGAGLKVSY